MTNGASCLNLFLFFWVAKGQDLEGIEDKVIDD
jgi:hypothetical protein